VIRSKPEVIETPLTEVLTREDALIDRGLFGSTVLEHRFPARGFSLSFLLHLWVAICTPLIPYLFPEKLNLDARRYRVKIIDFRIPTPLFYTPPEPQAPKKTASRPKRLRTPEPARLAARAADRGEAPPAASTARRLPKLELPVSLRSRSKDVIIQPDQPPNIAVTKIQALPSAFLWAQQPAPIEISRLIGAPRQPERPTFTLPQAQPKVQRPNQELPINDLQIGSAPVMTWRPPQLPVPPANISPVSVPVYKPSASRGELPSTVLPEGPPINLISLMQRPAPPATGYLLELGNRLAEVTDPVGPNRQPGPASTDPAKGSVSGSGPDPSTTSPGASGTHADILSAGSQPGASASASPGEPDIGSASDTGKQSARGYPTGHLGVVIVRPSWDETGLDGADALSGQPVYTVYFDVPGSARRWILQYCVPGAESKSLTRAFDGALRMIPKRSVQPPYPIDRAGVNLKAAGAASRIVVFAAINERGEPTGVRLIRGTGQPVDEAAAATLKRWSFRPAMRGGAPVAVEALFEIPLE
jgi:TonB family protein